MRRNAVLIRNETTTDANVEVRKSKGCKGVFARQPFQAGSIIFVLRGIISTYPTKYTIELGWHRHLTIPRRRGDDDYSWKFLNHSCAPNAYLDVDDLTLRAIRDIEAGGEITFNYLTTESEMAAPFECRCGSENCFGTIRGRNFLTPEDLEKLAISGAPEKTTV
jgi:hypothetical protein